MGGVPLPVVAQNLGHANTRMTEKLGRDHPQICARIRNGQEV
jgi:hypothetical protein